MTLEQVLAEMQARFTSGNSIAVERAMIRREEWEVILEHIGDYRRNLARDFREATGDRVPVPGVSL